MADYGHKNIADAAQIIRNIIDTYLTGATQIDIDAGVIQDKLEYIRNEAVEVEHEFSDHLLSLNGLRDTIAKAERLSYSAAELGIDT